MKDKKIHDMKATRILKYIAAAFLLCSFAGCNQSNKPSQDNNAEYGDLKLSKFDGFEILVPQGWETEIYIRPSYPLVMQKEDLFIDICKDNTQDDFVTYAENLMKIDNESYVDFRINEINKQKGVYEYVFTAKEDSMDFQKITRIVDGDDGLIYRINGDIYPENKDSVVLIVRSFRPTDFKTNNQILNKISKMADEESEKIENENHD